MSSPGVIKETGVSMEDSRELLRSFNSGPQEEMVPKAFRQLGSSASESPARSAALDYLAGILEKTLLKQLEFIEAMKDEKDFFSSPELQVVSQIQEQLLRLVKSSMPQACLILKWTTKVLGTLCSKFSNRGKCPGNGSLGDSIWQWMYCDTTRSLMEVLLIDLPEFNDGNFNDNVIMILLNACSAHSPHFDWAVARYASKHPDMISLKGLAWGLEKFIDSDGVANSSEMLSMVGVLSHLCGCHSRKVQNAMNELLKWCEGKESFYEKLSLKKSGAVPFLLHLSVSSPALLTALCKGPLARLSLEDLPVYATYAEDWARLAGGTEGLVTVATHAILGNQHSARHVLELILTAVGEAPPAIADVAQNDILEIVLREIELASRSERPPIQFLNALQKDTSYLMSWLLKDNDLIYMQTALVILKSMSAEHKFLLVQAVSFLLLRGCSSGQLSAAVKLAQKNSEIVAEAVSISLGPVSVTCFPSSSKDPHYLWRNLSQLMSWEKNGDVKFLAVRQAVRRSLVPIAESLSNSTGISEASLIMEVIIRALEDTPSAPPLTVHQTLMTVSATVTYFYLCLNQISGTELVLKIKDVTGIVKKLCEKSSYARSHLVRELLESSLFRKESSLFDGISQDDSEPSLYDNFSLLKDNYNQGSRQGRWQSTSLKSSNIRKIKRPHPDSPPDTTRNTRMLLIVLREACSGAESQPSLDAVVSVALLLVELVSPDVMYNGLPWPDEDFCKVTVERDLAIRRMMDQSPLIWSLLSFIAYHRPALCYCSVILRAVVATLIGQWSTATQQGRQAGQCENLINVTSHILQIMTLGQLLVPPLSAISEIVSYISPSQVVMVLKECVWAYMRDHVPSPALFSPDQQGSMWRDPSTSRPANKYTEPLRRSVLNNISTLASLYRSLFITETPDEE